MSEQHDEHVEHQKIQTAKGGNEPRKTRGSYTYKDGDWTYEELSEHRRELLEDHLAFAHADVADLLAEVERLTAALERSVSLQSHYAKQLNLYDRGERIEFPSVQAWLDRLVLLDKAKS